MRRMIQRLLGEQLSRRPMPPVERVRLDVRHRVLIAAPLELAWQHVIAPPPGSSADIGASCVAVIPFPHPGGGSGPEFVGIWRRPDGRVRAGISAVVAFDRHVRIVSRNADRATPLTLTTTFEAVDEGCIVAQHLEGDTPAFANDVTARTHALWLERALLHLKADVEGKALDPRDERDLLEALDAADPARAVAPVPVAESASVDVDLDPGRLWDLLAAPSAETLVTPSTEHVVRTSLADDPALHVVTVRRDETGHRSARVSRVEGDRPERLVERDVSAHFETGVVTTIEPRGTGSRLTESFTGWLPPGAGVPSGGAPVGAVLRARLEVVRRLAEGGFEPPRDPATGFRPPAGVTVDADPDDVLNPPWLDARPASGKRAAAPAGVLLPPPHLVVPAPAYEPDWDWYLGLTIMSLP